MKTAIVVGTRVRLAREWLRSAGVYTGEIPFATGIVEAIDPKFGKGLATVKWDLEGLSPQVLVVNLSIVGIPERN
jgi:hypothetical protein